MRLLFSLIKKAMLTKEYLEILINVKKKKVKLPKFIY